jgi:hypothetical protein
MASAASPNGNQEHTLGRARVPTANLFSSHHLPRGDHRQAPRPRGRMRVVARKRNLVREAPRLRNIEIDVDQVTGRLG